MEDVKENTDPEDELYVTTEGAVTEGTAPDADTQSSAASEAGDRMAEEGSRAPSTPAEGA